MINWQKYYENTKGKQPSTLVQEALLYVEDKSRSLDLGAGALVDSKFLLSKGFAVVAVDREKFSDQPQDSKFIFVQSSFKDYEFPSDYFDLVTAQFSLPFIGRQDFLFLLKKILSSLKHSGVFAGQLFGLNDEWNIAGSELVFHSRKEVDDLLAGLEVIKINEVERDGHLANGQPKHWHFFNIIARKVK